MIRTFFEEILLPVILFLLARSLLRGLFPGSNRAAPSGPPPPTTPPVLPGGELKRDPVCGTYVSTAVSVKRTVKGEVLHFCSTECRDKFAS